MNPEEIRMRIPLSELKFSASRSGGRGGQNVNKVSTKVELRFSISESDGLSDDEKDKILRLLNNKINSEKELIITSSKERSQWMNRKKAEEKFFRIIAVALTEKPKRKKTKPSQTSVNERIEEKKKKGIKKKLRRDQGKLHED
ncbi:MAG: alternative ribosome rescue aminoacyl-tRNA hydrolase ArfB [Bacteroidales bacterium]|jgi:ribosome-associated protein